MKEQGGRYQEHRDLLQVWLTLNNLVVDPHFRSKYKLDGFRKDTVCRIRRFLNDLLIDQLPVLKDLQRVVDEISLNYNANFNEFESGTLVIEQVMFSLTHEPPNFRITPLYVQFA